MSLRSLTTVAANNMGAASLLAKRAASSFTGKISPSTPVAEDLRIRQGTTPASLRKPPIAPTQTMATIGAKPLSHRQYMSTHQGDSVKPKPPTSMEQDLIETLESNPIETATLETLIATSSSILTKEESQVVAQMLKHPGSIRSLEARATINDYCTLLKAEQSESVMALLTNGLSFDKNTELPEYNKLTDTEKQLYIHASAVTEHWFSEDRINDQQIDQGTITTVNATHELAITRLIDNVKLGKTTLSAERLNFYFENQRVDKVTAKNNWIKSALLLSALSTVTVGTWNTEVYTAINDLFSSIFDTNLDDSHWDGMEPFSAAVGSLILAANSIKSLHLSSMAQKAAGLGGLGTQFGTQSPSIMSSSTPRQNEIKAVQEYIKNRKA